MRYLVWPFVIALATIAPTTVAPTAAAGKVSKKKAATPPVGSVGFNWLRPEKSKCRKFSKRRLGKIASRCRVRKSEESFDGKAGPWFSCKMSKTVEYLLFRNAKICKVQYETMQANAP
jgi:hypothetical protein